MDNKIRVLQCVSNMDRAGIETMLMNYYRKIDRDKIQFDFLVNKKKPGDYDKEIIDMGGKIYVTPGLNPLKWFKYQKFMKNLFNDHPEYKIIHCQNETMGFPALYAAKKFGIPIRISHSHNTIIRKDLKYFIKLLYKSKLKKNATNLVACSKTAGQFLFGEDVYVIKNTIEADKFKYNDNIRKKIRENYCLHDKYVIGHVGRFEPQKNHSFLIDVFYEYLKINSNAVLMLIGSGSLYENIKNKVIKLKIEKNVLFIGNVANVNEYYQAMDVFVLPSQHEGLPVVGVEAQYSDLPCLFANNITTETEFNDVEYLSINDTSIWVDKLNYYYVNRKKRKIINNKIYDINNSYKELEKFYFNLLKENGEDNERIKKENS